MDKEFEAPLRVQEFNRDIELSDLKYHDHRVLVSKEFTFDASHHLHAYEGKCKGLHGHTYKVVFGISGRPDYRGLVIDFGDIKKIWKKHLEPFLDHRYLNETLPKMNTTAENLVYWIYGQMAEHLERAIYLQELDPQQVIQLEFVRLYETPTSYAEITKEWFHG